jgi:phosphoribosylamine--glycine ligase
MMRYRGDLLALLLAVAEGRLGEQPAPDFSGDTALTVVMAAQGYPGTPDKGGTIDGIARAEATGARVFQAGTALQDGALMASGGRVLAVTATATTIAAAQQAAYAAVAQIDFPSGFNRSDIGWREIARQAE